jgi:hypothetical protein
VELLFKLREQRVILEHNHLFSWLKERLTVLRDSACCSKRCFSKISCAPPGF